MKKSGRIENRPPLCSPLQPNHTWKHDNLQCIARVFQCGVRQKVAFETKSLWLWSPSAQSRHLHIRHCAHFVQWFAKSILRISPAVLFVPSSCQAQTHGDRVDWSQFFFALPGHQLIKNRLVQQRRQQPPTSTIVLGSNRIIHTPSPSSTKHQNSTTNNQPSTVTKKQSSLIKHQSSNITHPPTMISHHSAITNQHSPVITHHPSLISHPSNLITHQSSVIINQLSTTYQQSSILNHQSSIFTFHSSINKHQSPIITPHSYFIYQQQLLINHRSWTKRKNQPYKPSTTSHHTSHQPIINNYQSSSP